MLFHDNSDHTTSRSSRCHIPRRPWAPSRYRRGFVWLVAIVFAATGCRPGASEEAKPATIPDNSPANSSNTKNSAPFVFDEPRVFSDVRYRNGESGDWFAILEALGGGVATIDLDRDGLLDFVFASGGDLTAEGSLRAAPIRFFRGVGEPALVRDASDRLPSARSFSHGVSSADYDSDGFADLLITGYGGMQFLRNLGDGTFDDVTTSSGLTNPLWSTGAAWGDINGDAAPDLVVANYVNWSVENNPKCFQRPEMRRDTCPPKEFVGQDDACFLSNSDGTFQNAFADSGLPAGGNGLGALLADFDDDRDLDLYVANDGNPNFVCRNDGGKFVDISALSGADVNERGGADGSMGLELGDFDGDLIPDLWVSNYEQESMALYRGHPGSLFQHVSAPTGVAGIGATYVGWGMVLSDFDGDGDEDVFISTGHAVRYSKSAPRLQRPIVLRNDDGKRFENVAEDCDGYPGESHLGRGVAGCDVDNDGRSDLVVTDLHNSPTLLRNTHPGKGSWIGLRMTGTVSEREATGARIVVRSGGVAQLRMVKSGRSYLSTCDPRLLVWLPADTKSADVEIVWPSGRVDRLPSLETGRYHAIVEGRSL